MSRIEGVFAPPPFHPDRPTLVAPVRVDGAGAAGPTRAQARGKQWRSSSHGLFVPATADADDPQQRIVEAAAILRPPDGITGWAALHWMGARWFTGFEPDGSPLPVPVVAKKWLADRPGISISQEYLRPGEIDVIDGLPVTTAVRATCFEMRHASNETGAVTALDMASYSDLVSLVEAATYAETLGTWTGIPQCRAALAEADENAWSPQETRMRRVWTHLAGHPRPLCNVPVFDRSGRHVATPDLLDEEAGVVGEYDGWLHLVGEQRTRDVRREGALRALGLEYVTMLASDREDGYRSFLERLDTAYRNSRRAAPFARSWTTKQPSWWIDTSTVDARRNLPPHLRDRLLAYRRAA